MTARNIDRRDFEDQAEYGAPLRVFLAVASIGLALILMYVALAAPQPGTMMGAIQNVMRGLGGSLAPALPLILMWVGVLCALAAAGKPVSPWRVVCDSLCILLVFGAVQLFSADEIVRTRMKIVGWANFVSKSYAFGAGGGALGAFSCWALYRTFGVVGGFIGMLVLALILQTLTGRTIRFMRWTTARIAVHREARALKKLEKNEQTFDEIAPMPAERPREPRPRTAQRPRKARDPHSESIITGEAAPRTREPRRPAQRPQTARPAEGRPARAAGQPARKVKPKPAEIDFEGEIEAATMAGKRRAAAQAEQAKAEKARPKPVEASQPIDLPEEEIAARATVQRPAKKPPKAEPGMVTQEDLAAFGIASIDEPTEEKRPRDSFAPDRPSALKDAQAEVEKLRIEPDAYEAEEDDEPPFDMTVSEPEIGIAAAKLPKIPLSDALEDEDDLVYNYPPIDLLAQGEAFDGSAHAQRDMEKAQLLEETLKSFGITTRLIGIAHGPAVTRFELQPAAGVKVSRITSLSDDIALNLAAMSVRIEAPIPGKAAVGVEIPNDKVEMVRLRDVLESPDARKHPSKIAVGLGKDNAGRYIVADIAKMPHVLIAGQTGSGKSVCINSIITSILFRATPEEVQMILIDPKVVELSIYNDIPHLVCPVVTDPKKAASALQWAVAEMTRRYRLFADHSVRDIKNYNKHLQPGEKPMPQMVIVIDELADLMMVAPGEVEDSICRLAQLARACGMHLVIATQRPSVNVITGIIKANIPTRIAFSVASQVDSRTMIDHGGAEKLLGNGDMLFVPNGIGKPMRVQGAWVSDEEVNAIVSYIKDTSETAYDEDMIEHMNNAVKSDAEKEEAPAEFDPRLAEAVEIVVEAGQASVSMLQRRMRVGYARAGRLVDEMTLRGIISEADGAKPRNVLMSREQINQLFEQAS